MLKSVVQQVVRILAWQGAWLVLTTVVAAVTWGARFAWSAAVGGGIGLAASAYLAIVLIKRSMQLHKRPSVAGLFGNWMVKSALTVGLLAIALRSKALSPPWVLAAWIGSLAVYWVCMVFGRASDARGNEQNVD